MFLLYRCNSNEKPQSPWVVGAQSPQRKIPAESSPKAHPDAPKPSDIFILTVALGSAFLHLLYFIVTLLDFPPNAVGGL